MLNPPLKTNQLLTSLNQKSVEQLLSSESFNINTISKSSSLHKSIVEKLLAQLMQQLTVSNRKIYEDQKKKGTKKNFIEVDKLFQGWEGKENVGVSVGNFEVVQIAGRSGAGKSMVVNEFVVQCLKEGVDVVYLDSFHNSCKLFHRLSSLEESDFKSKLSVHEFRTLSELTITLHSISQNLLDSSLPKPTIFFIDCLTKLIQTEIESSQAGFIQFKTIDKLKKLILEISDKIGTIVYTQRSPINCCCLFQSQYRQQRVRPRSNFNGAKIWDSIAGKTLCVDFVREEDGNEIIRVINTKGVDCEVKQFTRKPNCK